MLCAARVAPQGPRHERPRSGKAHISFVLPRHPVVQRLGEFDEAIAAEDHGTHEPSVQDQIPGCAPEPQQA